MRPFEFVDEYSVGSCILIFVIFMVVSFFIGLWILRFKNANLSDTSEYFESYSLYTVMFFVMSFLALFISIMIIDRHPGIELENSGIVFMLIVALLMFLVKIISHVIVRAISYFFLNNKFSKLSKTEQNYVFKVTLICGFILFKPWGTFAKYAYACLALYLSSLFWMTPSIKDIKKIIKKFSGIKDLPLIFLFSAVIMLFAILAKSIFNGDERVEMLVAVALVIGLILAVVVYWAVSKHKARKGKTDLDKA